MNASFFLASIDHLELQHLAEIAAIGFDGVILSESQNCLANEAKNRGLKVILKPNIPALTLPFQKEYSFHHMDMCDAIYWESPYFFKDYKKELLEAAKLPYEIFLDEIAELEKHTKLLYHLPPGLKPRYLEKFQALETHFTFSVYEGEPFHYHRSENTFWQMRNANALPILHLLDGPFFILDPIRRFFMQPLKGALLKMEKLPEKGSYGDANLNMCIQALKHKIRPEDTLTKWLKEHKPYLKYQPFAEYLLLYSQLQDVNNEDAKSEAQLAIRRLEKEKKSHHHPQMIKELDSLIEHLS